MHHSWWTLFQAGLFLTNKVCGVRQPRNLGHEDSVDLTLQSADYKLSMDLLRNYPAGYNVLPTANPHDVVNITLQLALYHIVDMNERAQTLTTNCEIITKWHDVFLMWNPEDYDNIRDTRLPWERVWTPDIVLYNAAGDGEQGREMRTLIQVDYQGNVTLLTQAIYMSKCKMDVTYYPFDVQTCELKFASWSTEVSRINISIGNIDKKKLLGLYSSSGVFELKRMWAERHEEKDPCCEDKFADVTYYMIVWRKPKFFLFNYIQPAVLINIIALFVFLIPAESGEKVTLGISTMLNMTVFLMTVTSGIPPTDNTPILSIYYATVMVLTTAATVLGVIVLRIHHQGRRGILVPPYLRRLGQWMAMVTCSKYPPVEEKLANLTRGNHPFLPRNDSYCYNIKEELRDFNGKSSGRMNFNIFKRSSNQARKNLPPNSPRYRPQSRLKSAEVATEISEAKKLQVPHLSLTISDQESQSDLEETPLKLNKKPRSGLWKKVSKNIEGEKKEKDLIEDGQSKKVPVEDPKDPWKDLSAVIMEEKYKAEERREIIGEEWRKISRILDRFLLIIFSLASLITTLWCIFVSPHYPDPDADSENIALTSRNTSRT